MFVDREAELEFLEARHRARGAQLVVVWGRRRVGKTALLTRFAERHHILYHLATRSTAALELARFSERVAEYYGDPVVAVQPFSSWDVAFRYLASRPDPPSLVLDEFPYLAESDASFPTVLQAAWDERLRPKGARLYLCGSSVGMVERLALSHDAPLYGRRTGQWRVQPLRAWHVGGFVKGGLPALLPYYAVMGGVPHYLSLLDPKRTLADNLLEHTLTRGAPLYEEIPFLLREEFREPRVYFSILASVAGGAERFGEISSKTGLERANLTRYLGELAEVGLLRREVPITHPMPDKSRSGLHRIADPFTRYWFRFVHGHRDRLEMGDARAVLRERVLPAMDAFVAPVVEEVARDVFCETEARALVPFEPVFRGRHWSPAAELDVVLLDEARQKAFVAEVKWSKKAPSAALLDDLRGRVARVPELSSLELTFAVVTRSGAADGLGRRLKRDERFLALSNIRTATSRKR
ncbi:MAG TPA: ATP-binding protein [Polyangiaceae bacterium]